MSERVSFTMKAESGERFATWAADGHIGDPVAVQARGRTIQGILVAAEVSQDGTEVTIAVDVPDGTLSDRAPVSG
jgi:hypothetical protein